MSGQIRRAMAPSRARLQRSCDEQPVLLQNFDDRASRDAHLDSLVAYQASLNVRYVRFHAFYEQVCAFDPQLLADDAERNLVNQLIDTDSELIGRYDDIVAMLTQTIVRLTREQEAERALNVHPAVAQDMEVERPPNHRNFKLHKMGLLKFAGDILKWNQFWQSFSNGVHNNRALTAAEKMNYLVGQLEGQALESISGLTLEAEHYPAAIELLTSRYGKRSAIIEAHYKALTNLPPASNQTSQLRTLYDTIEQHLHALAALGEPVETHYLVCTIKTKLPALVFIDIRRQIQDDEVTVQGLRTELRRLVTAREEVHEGTPPKPKEMFNRLPMHKLTTTSTLAAVNKIPQAKQRCVYCSGEHWSEQCPQFTTIVTRKKRLQNRCFNCLKEGHSITDCKRSKPCFHCKETRNHHSSLCPKRFQQGMSAVASHVAIHANNDSMTSQPTMSVTAPAQLVQATGTSIYLQTAKVKVHNPNTDKLLTVRALLDSGSQRSYVSTKLAKQLQLQQKSLDKLSIYTFGNSSATTIETPLVDITLITKTGTECPIQANVMPTITGNVHRPALNTSIDSSLFTHLELADEFPQNNKTVEVDILIGNDFYLDVITNERIDIAPGLSLIGSAFGWILSGRTKTTDNPQATWTNTSVAVTVLHANVSSNHIEADPCLSNRTDVPRFWELETIGIKDKEDHDDEECIQQFNNTLAYREHRYHIQWPWKDHNCDLPTNYPLALGRLKSLIKRHDDPEFYRRYQAVIDDQLAKGIIELVVREETPPQRIHYLPHQAVWTPDKATTKLRIVFDGSAKASTSDVSLNECLYRGPSFLSDVCAILLRFRLHKIGIVSDIEKAFLQFGLQEKERDSCRFLWLIDSNKRTTENNLLTLRFCRVPFGVISSPFMLNATIRHHLSKQSNPTSQAILNNIYVDNIVLGVNTHAEAVQLYTDTKSLFQEMSMNVREWNSNDKEFIAQLPANDQVNQTQVKVLGIRWDTKEDTLSLSFTPTKNTQFTKRDVLKTTASIYDPLGFLSPVTLLAKLFLQSLWSEKLGWDDNLTELQLREWQSILKQIETIDQIAISRPIGLSEATTAKDIQLELHCFCDASKKAYGACIYLRMISSTKIETTLLYSKARLAPLKIVTLPRLELLAVQIGSQITTFVKTSLQLPLTKVYIWSDSQCVLHWLHSTKPQTIFVANRIQKIKELSNVWYRYVPTDVNPADLTSRGVCATSLSQSALWWHGPQWLQQDHTHWPPNIDVRTNPVDSATEAKTTSVICVTQHDTAAPGAPFNINYTTYSSLPRLLRVSAYVKRFCDRLRTHQRAKSANLTTTELKVVLQLWLQYIQTKRYADIFFAIQHQKPHPLVQQFELFVDNENLLRCGGRLTQATLPQSAINPVLLPKQDHFTMLVIRSTHEKLFHAGVSHTLAKIRDHYWIPSGRSVVFRYIQTCTQCKRYDGGPFKAPLCPDLPKSRVSCNPAFTVSGIDYFGPMLVKSFDDGITINKVWGFMANCFSTRAVHLELVNDLSSYEFLLAFKRFIARRGKPKIVYSDNAKQFRLVQQSIQSYCTDEMIQWQFLPERSPWMGGTYERMVRLIKQAFKKSIGPICLTAVQLETLLTEIENVINTRPLVYIGSSIDNRILLTPAHFLRLNPDSTSLPISEQYQSEHLTSTATDLLERWSRGQQHLQKFWNIWKNDYLKELRNRHNRVLHQPRILSKQYPQIGDLVLIKTEAPRGTWPYAIIKKLNQGADGRSRSALLQTKNGQMITRPVVHLYPLECKPEATEEQ